MPQNLKNRKAPVQQKGFTLFHSTIYTASWIGAEEGGYWLCARRLEEGTFRWPSMEGACARYRREELLLLLGGIDLKETQARKWYRRRIENK